MLVNHGCLTSETPFILRDALNSQSSVNFSTYGPPKLHYAVSTSTESPTRFYRHLPLPLETSNTTNPLWQIPKTGVIARQQHSTRTVTNAGEERNRPSVLFRSARAEAEGDRKAEVENSSGPESPLRSDCQPNSPAESSSCSRGAASPPSSITHPKAHNWKKYKFIVLNSTDGAADGSSLTPSHTVAESTNKNFEEHLLTDRRSVWRKSWMPVQALASDAVSVNVVSCVFRSADDCIKKEERGSALPNTLTEESSLRPTGPGEYTCFLHFEMFLGINSIYKFGLKDIHILGTCVSQNGQIKLFFII